MVYNRAQAVRRAKAADRNVKGMCQNWVWNIFGSHAVGDVDHDGDADAVDGWKSEPVKYRHTDRNPPAGVPVAYSGGSEGNGHRAVTLGRIGGTVMIRSSDAGNGGQATFVGTVPLDWPEREWGMRYLGWSESISGELIPIPPKHTSRGPNIDSMIKNCEKSFRSGVKALKGNRKGTVRYKRITKAQQHINQALKYLRQVGYIK